MSDPTVPYGTAKGYIQSAYLLMSNPARFQVPDDTTLYLAFCMLFGFAVELYFKSFLMNSGHSEKELSKHGLRHNLRALHELAASKGLQAKGLSNLVDLLADHHKNYTFRYMKPDNIYKPISSLSAIFSIVSALDNAVDTAVGASVSRGKSPGGTWVFPDGVLNHWRLPLTLHPTPIPVTYSFSSGL